MSIAKQLAAVVVKRAAELKHRDVRTPLELDYISSMVFPRHERVRPSRDDAKRLERILQYMAAARPAQLDSAVVYLNGPSRVSDIVSRIHSRADHDTLLEKVWGSRYLTSQLISSLPASGVAQMATSYIPHANAVILNQNAPGALIHELGHGVDSQRRDGESNFRRFMRGVLKPELLEEGLAWKKGRRAYQQGFAADTENNTNPAAIKEYLENMRSYNSRKYPAYGTYAGGAAGTVLGAIAGLAMISALAKDSDRVSGAPIALGTLFGGALGVPAGALAGKAWAAIRGNANERRALKAIEKLRSRGGLEDIQNRLAAMRQKTRVKSETVDGRAGRDADGDGRYREDEQAVSQAS